MENLEKTTGETPGFKIRALVVDDEPLVGRVTERLLGSMGVEAKLVLRSLEGVEACRGESFDVIVSDIVMPELDGLGLLKAVRAFNLDIPIVLLTGSPSIATARQAVELGAFRYLTKPINSAELEDAVRKAAFAHRIAKLKREAAALQGLDDNRPGDMTGLQIALDTTIEQLWMAYQPIVRASDGSVYSYEALMRSHSRALPHPGAILDAAERLNRLEMVGRAVRRKSVEPLNMLEGDILLFVNVHPKDFLDKDLLDSNAPLTKVASRVVLEITERASLEHLSNIGEKVAWLRSQGFRIAIDDLGAGYAGLSSFATLEPDFVKLDMTLTRDVDKNVTKQKLVRTIADLCRDLGILVVAEGIETVEERDCCVQLGADLLQGYFMARPGEAFPEVHW